RVLDALILRIARQRVAFFLRDLVLRHHRVFAGVGNRILGLQARLGVGHHLGVLCLGFLHAHVLVVALLGLASFLRGLVVGIRAGDRGLVFVLPVALGCAGGIGGADGKHTHD